MIRHSEVTLLTPAPSPSGVYEAPYLHKRTVPCGVRSVYSNDFFQAMAQGHTLSWVLILGNYREYQDEPTCIFEGHPYKIIRTYVRDDLSIELTLERMREHEI